MNHQHCSSPYARYARRAGLAAFIVLVLAALACQIGTPISPSAQAKATATRAPTRTPAPPPQAGRPDPVSLAFIEPGNAAAVKLLAAFVDDSLPGNQIQPITALAVSPDGSMIVVGRQDGSIETWDSQGQLVRQTSVSDPAPVVGLAFSHDGRLLASADGGMAMVQNASDGRPLQMLPAPGVGGITSLAFSPLGIVVAGASDGTIYQWDATSGTLGPSFTGHTNMVRAVAVRLDGVIASGGMDGAVRVWEPSGLIDIPIPQLVQSIAFSPGGEMLAIGELSGGIEVQYNDAPHFFNGHRSGVSSLSFSPDSRLLASSSGDGTVRLWDTAHGETLNTLHFDASRPTVVLFTQDGCRLIAGGSDGVVRVWGVLAAPTPPPGQQG